MASLPAALGPVGDTSVFAPQPLVSSRSRRWNGLLVELYRVRDVDIVKNDAGHTVTVFLRGPVDLTQKRCGRVVRRTMRAGDIIVAPAGEPKSLQHAGEAELLKLRLAASFVAAIADDVVAGGSGRVELLDNFGTRDARIERVALRLLGEMEADEIGSRLCAESLATELVVHLLRRYSTPATLADGGATMLPRYKLQRVTDYIEANLREPLTLGTLSSTLTMSPYHFAHAFRQTTGFAPHRYVLLQRVERAKSLLRGTDLPITEIAHQVGYSSQSSFSVIFRRFTGRTPRAFRNAS